MASRVSHIGAVPNVVQVPQVVQRPGAIPATPRRSGSGPLPQHAVNMASQQQSVGPMTQASRASQGRHDSQGRQASPEVGRSQVQTRSAAERLSSHDNANALGLRLSGAHSAALLAPAAVAIAASTPVLRGRGAMGLLASPGNPAVVPDGKAAPRSLSPSSAVSKVSLLAGSSLGHLISKVATNMQEKEQEMKKQQAEQREIEELLARSKEELQQLVSVVSQLHDLQQSANEVLPDVLQVGPERPRPGRARHAFVWQPSQEYAGEFDVSGDAGEIVTKVRDFEDQGWVIPVGGSWRFTRGGLYRWTVRIERKCPSRPQLQLGIHGLNHSQPWRLITTSRCSWSRDDDPWQDRPGGDRLIDEGDYVHLELDMRGVEAKCGTFGISINDEPFEQFFDDIPLNAPYPLIPVVSMGGDQSRVRLCPSY